MQTATTANTKRIAAMLQVWDSQDVLDMIRCTRSDSWLMDVLRTEMAHRGLDENGEWVGFVEAHKVWNV